MIMSREDGENVQGVRTMWMIKRERHLTYICDFGPALQD